VITLHADSVLVICSVKRYGILRRPETAASALRPLRIRQLATYRYVPVPLRNLLSLHTHPWACQTKRASLPLLQLGGYLSASAMATQRMFVFSAQCIETDFLHRNHHVYRGISLGFTSKRLTRETSSMAVGSTAVCSFVNDDLGRDVLRAIKSIGINVVLLRCAGFNNVDLAAAKELGVTVMRVPAYSPWAVAEHAVTLLLSLNRQYVSPWRHCQSLPSSSSVAALPADIAL
jgi:D-isomer specific 2-hydroxyacid dehydrogenase, catalytic domain